MKTVEDWTAQLSKPYWMPHDPRVLIKGLTPDHMGPLNLMWVLTGKRVFTPGYFDTYAGQWRTANVLCKSWIGPGTFAVGDYATLYTERMFYERIFLTHPNLFKFWAPLPTWIAGFQREGIGHGRS